MHCIGNWYSRLSLEMGEWNNKVICYNRTIRGTFCKGNFLIWENPVNMSGSYVATSHLRPLTIWHGIVRSDNFSLLRISATRVIPILSFTYSIFSYRHMHTLRLCSFRTLHLNYGILLALLTLLVLSRFP